MEDYDAHRMLINLRKKKIVRFIWTIALTAAVVLFIYVLSEYIKSTRSVPDENDAYEMAQIYVKQILRRPETAVFPDADDINIIYQDSLWWVHGFVSAMNDIGKLDRSQILVRLKFLPKTKDWLKTDLVVTNPSIFKDRNSK